MYKVVGADQREYGPAGSDQIQAWIREHRLNGRSLVQAEGTDQWRPLSEFPEFQSALAQFAWAAQAADIVLTSDMPDSRFGTPRTNVLAVLGLIMGLLSLTLSCCCYGLPFNVLGLVFSVLGLSQINRNRDRERGKGLAIASLILSLLSLLLGALGWLFVVALGTRGPWK